jgi:hypothetical protein
VGREGVVGAMAGLGLYKSLVRVNVQLPLTASRIARRATTRLTLPVANVSVGACVWRVYQGAERAAVTITAGKQRASCSCDRGRQRRPPRRVVGGPADGRQAQTATSKTEAPATCTSSRLSRIRHCDYRLAVWLFAQSRHVPAQDGAVPRVQASHDQRHPA